MELDKITLFSAIKKRINWLGQRQEVLAHNVANADTPDYRARDIEVFKFRELVRRENSVLNMTATGPNHLSGRRRRVVEFRDLEIKNPYETSPTGNSVVLEEQMAMINESSINHKLTTNLYKKHLNMLRVALGTGR